ncbi:MAG TPA: CpXC domain-containing protein [Ktedonobacteraceae bacterium]|nr:CpXC domain-containing protein [Ktedonobacteraceae bacterium]
MSRSTPYTLTCPCGNTFTSPVYEYVNTAQDPQLQYTVLAGLLNVPTCPICGRRAALARPFVYSDPAHNLLVYVHPTADVPDEGRLVITEKLRNVYQQIGSQDLYDGSEGGATRRKAASNGSRTSRATTSRDRQKSPESPSLQVVFGLDELTELINAELNQEERLGRLALSTHSRSEAERGQMLDIARKFASEMQCQVEVEDMPDEYTVWLYGSRRQIGAIMRELAPRG